MTPTTELSRADEAVKEPGFTDKSRKAVAKSLREVDLDDFLYRLSNVLTREFGYGIGTVGARHALLEHLKSGAKP
jgi:hypothetical protein